MANESSEVSLVDMLTNTFIVSMILMCIVTTTMGESEGDGLKKIMAASGVSEIYTSLLTKKEKKEKDPPVLTISIVLPGYETNVKLELDTKGLKQHEENNISVMKGAYQKNRWIALRNGDSLKGKWALELMRGTNLRAKDSITVLCTIGTLSILKRIPYSPVNQDFIQVEEPVLSGENIFIYGSGINSY